VVVDQRAEALSDWRGIAGRWFDRPVAMVEVFIGWAERIENGLHGLQRVCERGKSAKLCVSQARE
jgi:hypothetical protein